MVDGVCDILYYFYKLKILDWFSLMKCGILSRKELWKTEFCWNYFMPATDYEARTLTFKTVQ